MSLIKKISSRAKITNLIAIALCFVTSCTYNYSQTKRKLVSASKSLTSRPFDRNEIIQNYDLVGKKSLIMNGGIRSNMMLFVEAWEVSDGFKIFGVKYKFVGALDIDPNYIESIEGQVQTEFDRIYIESNNNKIIFDTNEK